MIWWKHMPSRKPAIVLHHFGVDDLALRELEPLVERLAAELALDLRLALHGGDAVIIDEQVRRTVPAQLLAAFSEDRPVLTLKRGPVAPGRVRGAILYEDLLESVQALAERVPAAHNGMLAAVSDAIRPRDDTAAALADPGCAAAQDSGYDSTFDSRYPGHALTEVAADVGNALFLRDLHLGKGDPEQPPLVASYGPGAAMVIDFATGRVMLEQGAWDELRLRRRLPERDTDSTHIAARHVRELDLVLWDLGWAAGAHPLQGAPANWWHTALVPVAVTSVARYSSAPLHREMARVLARGGVTPSQLRRECRAGLRELRCFLQACSFLHLMSWGNEVDPIPQPVPSADLRAV